MEKGTRAVGERGEMQGQTRRQGAVPVRPPVAVEFAGEGAELGDILLQFFLQLRRGDVP